MGCRLLNRVFHTMEEQHMEHKMLYKYKSVDNLEYLLDIIQNQRLYLADIEELNDPLEGLMMECSGWAGCSYYNGTPILHPHYRGALEKYRILSLTEEKDNIVMWSHYSNNFNGVCIEIGTEGQLSTAEKVDYSETVVKNRELSLYESAELALRMKLKEWSYEKEWRVIISDQRYLQLKKGEIKKIIIGHKVSELIRDIIIKMCKQNDIKVVVAFVDRTARKYHECTIEEYEKILREYLV